MALGLGSSNQLGIGIVIQLRDQFSGVANNVMGQMNALHKNANQVMRNNLNSLQSIGIGMTAAGAAMALGLKGSVNAALEYEKRLVTLKALGNLSNDEMKKLGQTAMDISSTLPISTNKILGSMEELIKKGMDPKATAQVIDAMAKVSVATGDALEGQEGVAAAMSNMMLAWGFQAKDAIRVGDLLTVATVKSAAGFGDLAEAMKYSQDVLKGVGVSFEESLAIMAFGSNLGLRGSMLGTGLANFFREVNAAAAGAKAKIAPLAMLGLTPGDLKRDGKLLPAMDLLTVFAKKIENLPKVEGEYALGKILSVRGARPGAPMIKELATFLREGDKGAKKLGLSLKEFVKILKEAGSGAEMNRMILEKTKSTAVKLQILNQVWDNFKIRVGEALLPLLDMLVPKLIKLVKVLTTFIQTPAGKTVVYIWTALAGVLLTLGPILIFTSLIGRSFLTMGLSVANLGRTFKWVWATAISGAARYLGLLTGISSNIVFKGGAFRYAAGTMAGGKAVGGQVVPGAWGMSGGGGLAGGFSKLGSTMGPVIKGFGWLALISGSLALMGVNIKDQLMGVIGGIIWIFKGLYNVLVVLVNSLITLYNSIPFLPNAEKLNYADMSPGASFKRHPSSDNIKWGPSVMSKSQDEYKAIENYMTKGRGFSVVNNIHIDGVKTITQEVNEKSGNELLTHANINH